MKREKLTQQQCEDSVVSQMTAWAEFRKLRPDLHETLDEFIWKNGKMYTKRGELPTWAKVTPQSKECYFNAWRLRTKLKGKGRTVQYCEGYVMHANFIIPVLHGWLVDEKGEVLDTSIETKGAVAYYGVMFKDTFTDSIWPRLRREGLIGILGNGWQLRLGPKELEKELTHETNTV